MSLVVIGASATITGVAQSLDEEVIFVQRPGAADPRLLRDDVDELYTLEYTDPQVLHSFAAHVLRPRGVRAIVSVTETGLEPAAVLSQLLDLPATPPSVIQATRDKLRMRRILAERAPHLNVAFADAGDKEAVEALFLAHHEVIAKPVAGTASRSVHLVHSPAEVESLSTGETYLLEAFAPGREYSVEAFSTSGVHSVLAIAEKGTAEGYVEVSHLVPPLSLNDVQRQRLEEAVFTTLDALGVRDGPTHTEAKVQGDVVTIIETHTRPGGDGICDLVAITTGVDWRRVALGWPLGLRPSPGTPQAAAAANLFFTAAPGTVVKIASQPPSLPDARIVLWEIDVAPGDVVGPLRSSQDRVGMATIVGPSARACAQAMRLLGHDRVVMTEDERENLSHKSS
ncbi:ATP-grasp domain-containing protein [[Actinomadura] parvosata]|uniref:ATP-grasp domain-containing protein n=1 Tax=[Actinomadura] parvosata TaxID=1955412 RepID=UPI00406CF1D5